MEKQKQKPIYKLYDNDSELLYLISENNEEANEIIFRKYKPIIDLKVRKYITLVSNKGFDYNDLYQEGLIGLHEAIQNYREKKEVKFSTFATLCIDRKICSIVRKAGRKKYSILNESYSLDFQIDDDDKPLMDIIFNAAEISTEEKVVNKETAIIINKKIESLLTKFEKAVFDLKKKNFSNSEIAEILEKSYKSIESTLFRVRNKVRKILIEID